MSAKQDSRKSKKTEIRLDPQESHELQIILDRLAVQNPEGESLQSYLQSLRETLLGRDRLVATLLDRLSRDPTPVGFRAFAAFQDIINKKEFKRAVKQAAYRFSQKGYTWDREDLPQSKVVLIPKETRQIITHMIPAPDVDWFVAGFFPGAAGSESIAMSAYTENRFQDLSIRVVESTPKLYREFIQKLAGHLPESAPFEVPSWHAAKIYFEILHFHGEQNIPPEAEKAKRLFQPFYDSEKLPYAYQLFPLLEQPGEHFGEVDIESLLQSMPAEALRFPKEDLAPYFQKLQELERSVLVVRKDIQQERAMELINKAADDLCAGQTRFLYRRLFEEQALALKQMKSFDLAEHAWMVAQHLAGSANPSENPVITHVVALSIQSYWPDEFAGEPQQSASYEQTESGLILPR